MPSLAASRLTEAHRLGQSRIAARSVQDMLAAWSLIDPNRLDVTTPNWLRVALPLLQNRRRASAALAADYLRAHRLLELGTVVDFSPLLATQLDVTAATTSLTVTGPVSLKRAMTAGVDLAKAIDTAQANTSRSGMRHVLDGGRETIAKTVEADRYAIGYQRVGSGKTCKFCSMLIGRGAVYSGATAHFDAHDGCSCSAEPVYETS